MKKLMFVAVATLCGAVMADNEITSENIVGYMGKAYDAKGYYLTSPMFNGVSVEGMNIQDLKPSATNTIKASEISLYIINTERTTVGIYNYKPEVKLPTGKIITVAGWYNGTARQDYIFPKGQGFMLECAYPITLTFSGEVIQSSPAFVTSAKGYYRAGNMTPVPVSIQQIVPTSTTKIAASQISIYTYGTDRSPTGLYNYKPEVKLPTGKIITVAGWYDGTALATKTFAPGEGFVLETAYDDTTLTFPNPVK